MYGYIWLCCKGVDEEMNNTLAISLFSVYNDVSRLERKKLKAAKFSHLHSVDEFHFMSSCIIPIYCRP